MKQRIKYIDNLKALAIFTVVMGHVFCFTWNHYHDNIWSHLIEAYNMPLFFFLSGLFAKENLSIKQLGHKAKHLLLPFLMVGGCYAFLHNHVLCLLVGNSNMGYWFLLALFWIFCVFYFRCQVYKLVKPIVAHKLWQDLAFEVVFVIGSVVVLRILGMVLPDELVNALCLSQLAFNLPFFILGFWGKKHKEQLKKMILPHVNLLFAICFLVFCMVFYLAFYSVDIHHGKTIFKYLMAFSSIFILVLLARHYTIDNSSIQNGVSYLGTHSLQIYVLQYFFLPTTYTLDIAVVGGVNLLFLTIAESVFTIILCIVVIKIVNYNKFLSTILFGE